VDIGNKMIALAIKGLEELRFLAVTAVNANPGKSNSKRAGVMDDIKCKLSFCFEMYVTVNASTLASLPTLCPFFWKMSALASQTSQPRHSKAIFLSRSS